DLQIGGGADDPGEREQARLGAAAGGLPVARDVDGRGGRLGQAHDVAVGAGAVGVPASPEVASGHPGVLGTATHCAARSVSRCTTCSAAASESVWMVDCTCMASKSGSESTVRSVRSSTLCRSKGP